MVKSEQLHLEKCLTLTMLTWMMFETKEFTTVGSTTIELIHLTVDV